MVKNTIIMRCGEQVKNIPLARSAGMATAGDVTAVPQWPKTNRWKVSIGER